MSSAFLLSSYKVSKLISLSATFIFPTIGFEDSCKCDPLLNFPISIRLDGGDDDSCNCEPQLNSVVTIGLDGGDKGRRNDTSPFIFVLSIGFDDGKGSRMKYSNSSLLLWEKILRCVKTVSTAASSNEFRFESEPLKSHFRISFS